MPGSCFGPGSGPGGHPLAYVVLPPAAVREEHVGSQQAACFGCLWPGGSEGYLSSRRGVEVARSPACHWPCVLQEAESFC